MFREQEIITPTSFTFNLFAYGTVIIMFLTAYFWQGLYDFMANNGQWGFMFGFLGGPFAVVFRGPIILLVILSIKNMKNTFPRIEKVYSSVYAVLDVLLHQAILSILLFPWVSVLEQVYNGNQGFDFVMSSLINHRWAAPSWLPLIQIFLVRLSRESPDEISDYLFIPMRRKFVPWIHLIFSMMTFSMKRQMLIATGFAFFQVFLLRFNIVIRLPLIIYGIVQKLTPKIIKLSDGFVLIEQCFFDQLKSRCKFCQVDRSYQQYEEQLKSNRPANPNLRQKWLSRQNEQNAQQQQNNDQQEQRLMEQNSENRKND